MTLTTTTTRVEYPGAGSAGPFSYPFRILAAEHLVVTVIAEDGTETELTSADYDVTGVGNRLGGTVTLDEAVAEGETLRIERVVPLTQGSSFRNQSSFRPDAHEDALDYLVMIDQQQQDAIDRTFRLPTGASSGVSTELPAPAAGYVLAWDADAGALVNRAPSNLSTGVPLTFNVEDYRESGMTDREVVQATLDAAAEVASTTGHRAIIDFTRPSYDLGELSGYGVAFDLGPEVNGFHFRGHNTTLACETTDTSFTIIFRGLDAEDVTFEGFTLEDAGYSLASASAPIGAILAYFYQLDAVDDLRGGALRNCHVNGGSALLFVSGDELAVRYKGFRLEGDCSVTNCYYGLALQNNGDDVRGRLRCHNVKRAVIVYGVSDFDLELPITNDGTADATSNGLIDINTDQQAPGTASRPTRRGRIRASLAGTNQYSAFVQLQHNTTLGDGLIQDIDIVAEVDRDLTGGADLAFVKFRPLLAGVAEVGTTNQRWDNIRIAGSPGPATNATTGAGVIEVMATQNTPGRLTLDPSLFSQAALRAQVAYPGFIVSGAPDHLHVPTTKTPASAAAAGTKGDIAYDASYVYVCVADNTWKRAALSTW